VCGKQPEVAIKQVELTCTLIGLARAAQGKTPGKETEELMMQGLFATVTNVNFDGARIDELKSLVQAEKAKLGDAAALTPKNFGRAIPTWYPCVQRCFLAFAVWQPMRGMLMYWAKRMMK
jgi:hydroxylamine reductase